MKNYQNSNNILRNINFKKGKKMKPLECVIKKEEEEKDIKEPEQYHLEKALAKCGDHCMQEFEDVYNIWDWHKGWG